MDNQPQQSDNTVSKINLTFRQIQALIAVLGISLFARFITSPNSLDQSNAARIQDILRDNNGVATEIGEFPLETLTTRLEGGALEP